MNDCARGCLLHGQHIPDCPDADTCNGCAPRPADIGGYCQKHHDQLAGTINGIPHLIADLIALAGDTGRLAPPDAHGGDTWRRATKVDQMSPSPALETSDEAARWLHTWALSVADERAERGPFEYRTDAIPVPNPQREARYLTSRLEYVTVQPYVNDLMDEALQFKAALTRAAAADAADQRIPTRCPDCNQRTLIRPNGEDHVICRNDKCGAVWESDQLAMLAKVASA